MTIYLSTVYSLEILATQKAEIGYAREIEHTLAKNILKMLELKKTNYLV